MAELSDSGFVWLIHRNSKAPLHVVSHVQNNFKLLRKCEVGIQIIRT